ncbi:MAG: alkaline phosphatase [Chloroflexota bacterium]|jgi:alkaline phosphatase D|nr:alkaline phosphatase [Chloroflexota bacterium]
MSLFRHGVASGDPLTDRVVIWTRLTVEPPDSPPIPVAWLMARDSDLRDVVASGVGEASAAADHTVKVDVAGLEAGTRYWYRFEAQGERSQLGRTKTLPGAPLESVRFAQCSCSKFNAGFLNAYARIADRDDLDFVLHLGDYIYEAAQRPPASQTPGADIGRPFDPEHECVTLDDYRRRYAQYHADPDAQRMHRSHPIVGTVDDHELADGAWREGSNEHRTERDGPWETRKAAAFQARWEWTAARPPKPDDPSRVFRSVPLGDLAELFLIDTRSRRDQPARGEAAADPARSQLGAEQREWLLKGLRTSTAPWLLLGNGSVFSPLWREGFPQTVVPALLKLKLIHEDGMGFDPDQWEGYPAERAAIVEAMAQRPGEVVVFSGDIHAAMASEVSADPQGDHYPVAVELVTTSLTSQNLDDKMGWAPRTESLAIERELIGLWPHVQWCDLDSHGYIVVEVQRDRLTAQWWAVDEVLHRTEGEHRTAAYCVERGRPKLIDVMEELA